VAVIVRLIMPRHVMFTFFPIRYSPGIQSLIAVEPHILIAQLITNKINVSSDGCGNV
jgi:hypothetical protein